MALLLQILALACTSAPMLRVFSSSQLILAWQNLLPFQSGARNWVQQKLDFDVVGVTSVPGNKSGKQVTETGVGLGRREVMLVRDSVTLSRVSF